MSYICEKCKKQIKKCIPQSKIIKERLVPIRNGKFRKEIESEKKVCPKCGEKKSKKRIKDVQKKAI